jgi:hypothetical protein
LRVKKKFLIYTGDEEFKTENNTTLLPLQHFMKFLEKETASF